MSFIYFHTPILNTNHKCLNVRFNEILRVRCEFGIIADLISLNHFCHNRCQEWAAMLRPAQNCRHFADDIFKRILLNENVWISLVISLKFVPKVRINNITSLVQIMAWRRPGAKPLSEPMMASLLTHMRHPVSYIVVSPSLLNVFISYFAFQFII